MITSSLSSFKRIWQALIKYLAQASEIQVWQAKASDGHIYWRVYDPKTSRSSSFASEAEVRMWIEQSYYR